MSGAAQSGMDFDEPEDDFKAPDKRPSEYSQKIVLVIAEMIQRVPAHIRPTVITHIYMAMCKAYEKADMAHLNRSK